MPDGLALDLDGNLFITQYSLGVIKVVRPDGTLIGHISMPDKDLTNCELDPQKTGVLYVTAGQSLYVVYFIYG